MNRDRLTRLRDHLDQLPDKNFDYGIWFSQDGSTYPFRDAVTAEAPEANFCGTTGCVAGWCCVLLHKEAKPVLLALEQKLGFPVAGPGNCDKIAQTVLELTDKQAEFLFLDHVDNATREDAVRRIDHLLSTNGNFNDYDWTQESWYYEGDE